jgi:FkbM family methyltransferase
MVRLKERLRPLLPPLHWRNQLRVWLRRHPLELRLHYPDIGDMRLPPEPVVFDVGSNTGQFAESFLAWRPRAYVHAFEPQVSALEAMQSLLGAYERVRFNAFALGAEPCTRNFFVSRFDQASSFLPNGEVLARGVGGIDFTTREQIEVEIHTLADYVREQGIARIDLLKLDVQGFEIEVFKGAVPVLDRVDWIYSEAQFKELYADGPRWNDQAAFLSAHCFDLVRMCGFRRDDSGELMECDMLFRRRR